MTNLSLYLGVLLFSFIFTSIAIIPWIDLLYRLQMTEAKKKLLTPVGGGLLIIFSVTFLFSVIFPIIDHLGVYIHTLFAQKDELNIIFFSFIAFGLVGLFDDLVKIFHLKWRNIKHYKNLLLISLSIFISLMLYQNLGISILNFPLISVNILGPFYILFAAIIIMLFVKGFNASDYLDGLSCGGLVICLLAFWSISTGVLDTPISIFIALWIGSLISFVYFNVYPARIWLGNCGSYSFGATLAVIGLVLGKPLALVFIGAYFIISAAMSVFNTRLNALFLARGWPEPKVVMRTWLFIIMSSVIGLWLSQL